MNLTSAENVIKEVQEESGFEVSVRKLAAVWYRTRQSHPEPRRVCRRLPPLRGWALAHAGVSGVDKARLLDMLASADSPLLLAEMRTAQAELG